MKKILLSAVLLAIALSGSFAQMNRQALLADSLYRFSSYSKALKHYEKALKKESSPELLLGYANSLYKLQDYESAAEVFRSAENLETEWKVSDRLNYIESNRILGRESEVERLLQKWNQLPSDAENMLNTSIHANNLYYMDSAVYNIHETPLNTEFSEFSPVYYKDGVLFASSRSDGNYSKKKYHWNNENYLDLYYAAGGGVSAFNTNTRFHDGPVSFHTNGNKVIFTRNEDVSKRKDQRQLALFEADVQPDGSWVNILPLNLNNPDYSVSHPAVSEDGNILYFVSNMPGGSGGTDIYKSVRTENGWSAPENLGPEVNTSGNEMFPVIHNSELYFASDGHPGMGGLDIFIAESTGEKTFFIRNAGYPLNSTWDDFGLMTRDGRSGYFSSNRNGNDDIFAFEKEKIIVEITYVDEEENVLDSVATVLRGDTLFARGSDNITRLYMDRESLNELNASRSQFADTSYNIQTGDEFFISKVIPLRRLKDEDINRGIVDLYPIAVNDDSYDLFMGQDKNLLKADANENWRNHFIIKKTPAGLSEDKLEKIKALLEGNGYTVRVHDMIERIHFDFDKWDIRSSEYDKLNRVAQLLNTYPQTRVVIGAHTDKRGTDSYNLRLSKKRARSTVEYLIGKEVDSGRLKTKAYGESMLLIICEPCSEDEHQKNRRVTFDVDLED